MPIFTRARGPVSARASVVAANHVRPRGARLALGVLTPGCLAAATMPRYANRAVSAAEPRAVQCPWRHQAPQCSQTTQFLEVVPRNTRAGPQRQPWLPRSAHRQEPEVPAWLVLRRYAIALSKLTVGQ